MSLESAIPRELCSSCKDKPWGHSGWKEFYDESGGSARFVRTDRNIRNIVEYDLEPRALYKQSRHCTWCYMLIAGSDLPEKFEDLKPSGYDRISVTMHFYAPLQADPAKINSVYVKLELYGGKGGYKGLRVRFGLWSKPGENFSQIPPVLYCWAHDI